MEKEIKKLYEKDYLTQKDIIQLLLHNAQHMVTRDEIKEDNRELKQDLKEEINKLEKNIKEEINRLDKKIDTVAEKLDKKIDIVADKLDKKIDKVNSKFDKLQWLIVASVITILAKDYILSLIQSLFK